VSPKKSSASAWRDADPAKRPAPTSTTNIAAFIARTEHSTRRYLLALALWGSKFKGGGVQQQSAIPSN